MNNQDLAKIVRQVQNNKEQHFAQLFNEIHRTVYYLSYKFLDSEVEAQDVSQEIIWTIYNHIEELKLAEGFNNWMNRIIYSKCKDRVKQLANHYGNNYEEVDIEAEQLSQGNPEKLIQMKEKNKFVLEIIEELPIKQKEVVLLYYYQQLTASEIAIILSCSLQSVQNRLHKAKKSIRNRVEKSNKYTVHQLLSISGTPILFKILCQEANKIVSKSVKKQLWSSLVDSEGLVVRANKKQQNKVIKYKTKSVMFGIFGIVSILALLSPNTWVLKEMNLEVTRKANKKVEQNYTQILNAEENIIPNKESIEKVKLQSSTSKQEKTDVQMESSSLEIYDISTDDTLAIWEKSREIAFIQTAILEEKDLVNSKYVYNAGDKKKNASVYEEDVYKVFSEIIYHTTVSPVISMKHSSLLTGNIITYYISLENIGEIVPYEIIIKDIIPEHTEFVKEIEQNIEANENIEFLYDEHTKELFWIIERLELQETKVLVFQVRIKEEKYQKNQEIRNIAYMKVVEEENSRNSLSESLESYIKSNEIVYRMQ
jgi:RNA polymerase sigma factor, sigma-70 family